MSSRIQQLQKRFERGELPHVPWLDQLTLAAAVKMKVELAEAETGQGISTAMHLLLELPSFPLAVLYRQAASSDQATAAHQTSKTVVSLLSTSDALSTPLRGTVGSGTAPVAAVPASRQAGIAHLMDPEVGLESPAALKAQKLARGAGHALADRSLRPDTEERARIEAVLALPPNRAPELEDRELMWRFRYALSTDHRALTKFLKCVDWSDASEAKQAAELMASWSPIDVADALELLSPDFTSQEVRAHAVSVLAKTPDEELLYYLLQLVQVRDVILSVLFYLQLP
jgi:phosphatidylinositol 3-kinase